MGRFLLRRLGHAVFVVWGVVTVVFFLVRLTGDPVAFLVDQTATPDEIAHARHLLGLDRPLVVQYVDFLAAAPRGDFGTSIRERRPAMRMVLETERKTASFYAQNGKFMPDASLRSLFHELAEEGAEHYQRLRALAKRSGIEPE